MAGLGQRFKGSKYGDKPKHLIEILGKPMIEWAIDSLMNGLQKTYQELAINLIFVLLEGQDTNDTVKILVKYKQKVNNVKIYTTQKLTEGPAASCLLAKNSINTKEPLIIANCDQIMSWNFEKFYNVANLYDGCVVTYTSNTPKNSYAKVDEKELVTEIKEKEVISDISLNGIHYWKYGSDFVKSAEKMIEKNIRAGKGEFYVAPTYNELIPNKEIGIYHIPNSLHHAVGVPEDLDRFIEKQINENL